MSVQSMIAGLQGRLETLNEMVRLLAYEKYLGYLEVYGSDEETEERIDSIRKLLLDSEGFNMADLQRVMEEGLLSMSQNPEYPIPPLEKVILTKLINHVFAKE